MAPGAAEPEEELGADFEDILKEELDEEPKKDSDDMDDFIKELEGL